MATDPSDAIHSGVPTAGGPAHRLSAATFIIGAAVIVTLVGLLAALVTWEFHPKTSTPCNLNCPQIASAPTSSSALAGEPYSFTSSQFGFTVEVAAPPWKAESTSAAGGVFDTRSGFVDIEGAAGTLNATQLIQQSLSKLNPQVFPNIQAVGPLHGAHIGTVNAQGELFVSTYVPSSGQSFPVGIGVMVATRNGVTVRILALTPYDVNHDPIHGGMAPDAFDIDYALDEFRWAGQ